MDAERQDKDIPLGATHKVIFCFRHYNDEGVLSVGFYTSGPYETIDIDVVSFVDVETGLRTTVRSNPIMLIERELVVEPPDDLRLPQIGELEQSGDQSETGGLAR